MRNCSKSKWYCALFVMFYEKVVMLLKSSSIILTNMCWKNYTDIYLFPEKIQIGLENRVRHTVVSLDRAHGRETWGQVCQCEQCPYTTEKNQTLHCPQWTNWLWHLWQKLNIGGKLCLTKFAYSNGLKYYTMQLHIWQLHRAESACEVASYRGSSYFSKKILRKPLS